MSIVYLRNVGDREDECWVVCARFDEGAVPFCPLALAEPYHRDETTPSLPSQRQPE